MSTYYSAPALDSELSYRRAGLAQAAAEHRLARQARKAARTGRRGTDGHRHGH
jgi:hypothetical protein